MRWLLFGGGFAASSCAPGDLEEFCADAGGTAEERAQLASASHPAVVAIFGRSDSETYFCSGALVGARTVLTAAHCVRGRSEWTFEVSFAADLLDDESPVTVTSISLHPTQDMAALTLEAEAPAEATPLRWSSDLFGAEYIHTHPKERRPLRIVGYGAPAGRVDRCLRASEEVEELGYDPFDPNDEDINVILAGQVCKGDSGGPLLAVVDGQAIHLGVTSGAGLDESGCGAIVYLERLRRDDPWVLGVMGSDPVRIPCPPEIAGGPQAESLDCP